MKSVKTQVVFPESLLDRLDQVCAKRERSDFVVAAVEERLRRLAFLQILDKAAGVWKKRKEFASDQGIRKYLSDIRNSDRIRARRLGKGFGHG